MATKKKKKTKRNTTKKRAPAKKNKSRKPARKNKARKSKKSTRSKSNPGKSLRANIAKMKPNTAYDTTLRGAKVKVKRKGKSMSLIITPVGKR